MCKATECKMTMSWCVQEQGAVHAAFESSIGYHVTTLQSSEVWKAFKPLEIVQYYLGQAIHTWTNWRSWHLWASIAIHMHSRPCRGEWCCIQRLWDLEYISTDKINFWLSFCRLSNLWYKLRMFPFRFGILSHNVPIARNGHVLSTFTRIGHYSLYCREKLVSGRPDQYIG